MSIPSYTDTGLKDAPLVDSWQIAEAYLAPLETDMDGGNKRLRRRPGDETSRISFSILFHNSDFETFKTFVRETLNLGTTRFTMRVWTGTAMVSKTVQFASPYKESTN